MATLRGHATQPPGERGACARLARSDSGGGDLLGNDALVEGGTLGPALVEVDELGVVEAHQGEDRGVQVVDVEPVLDGVQANLVGGADGPAAGDAAAGHPHGEAV